MKKQFFIWTFLMCIIGIQAQTDVTSTYLTNADFETSPVTFSTNTTTPAYSAYATSGLLGASVYVPTGWTAVLTDGNIAGNSQYCRMATVSYGIEFSPYPDAVNGVNPPATDKSGNGGAGWTLSGAYGTAPTIVQTVTLPAGMYKLRFDAKNLNATKGFAKNLFGFEKAGKENAGTYSAKLNYGSAWESDSVVFTLNEQTTGRIRLGIQGISDNSGNNAKLFVDNVKLFYSDPNTALTNLIATAETLNGTLTEGSGVKTYLTAAIATAQDIIDNSGDITQGLADLQAAVDLVNAFKTAIDAAQSAYNASIEGSAVGEYSAAAKATLLGAINTAAGVSSSDAADIAAAISALNAALTTFNYAYNGFPQNGQRYYIKNVASEYYLTAPAAAPAGDSRLTVTTKIAGDATQIFTLSNPDPANPAVFNIAVGGKYLTKGGTNWTNSLADTSVDEFNEPVEASKFDVSKESSGFKIHALANGATYFLGPQNLNTSGSVCYLDKTAQIVWIFEEYFENAPTSIDNNVLSADPVVSEKYYSLQGVELPKQPANGLVIVKRTHQSGKNTISKVLRNAR